MNDKLKPTKTSVYLLPEIYKRVKKEAEKAERSYSDWVKDAIKAALANPGFLDPVKLPTEEDKILQNLKKAETEQLKKQEKIVDRLERLELKFDSMMEKFEVEQPVKDKSGKRIFDD